jgi:copper resistance protein C
MLAAGGLLTLGALWPGLGRAHAIVVQSTPAAGVRLGAAPGEVVVRFNGRIDHRRSLLSLSGPDQTVEALALKGETPADELRAGLGPLSPGAYRLHWQVLSADGHITRGAIPFAVGTP